MKGKKLLVPLLVIVAIIASFGAGYFLAPKPVRTEYLAYPSINETTLDYADYIQTFMEEEGLSIENRTLTATIGGWLISLGDFINVAKMKEISTVYRYISYDHLRTTLKVIFWFNVVSSTGATVPYIFEVD